jgi:hypothetical protein
MANRIRTSDLDFKCMSKSRLQGDNCSFFTEISGATRQSWAVAGWLLGYLNMISGLSCVSSCWRCAPVDVINSVSIVE